VFIGAKDVIIQMDNGAFRLLSTELWWMVMFVGAEKFGATGQCVYA
jgi:hypothetical protein